jgi:hypothetical protein
MEIYRITIENLERGSYRCRTCSTEQLALDAFDKEVRWSFGERITLEKISKIRGKVKREIIKVWQAIYPVISVENNKV